MEKNIFILLIIIVVCSNNVFSQTYIEGPDVVDAYTNVTYKIKNIPSGEGRITMSWGKTFDDLKISGVEGGTEWSATFIYVSHPSTVSRTRTISFNKNFADGRTPISVSKTITVNPNPISIIPPSKICPYGTQLSFSSVSPGFTRALTLTGNANINQNGVVSYSPNISSGTATVKVVYSYPGKNTNPWYFTGESTIQLKPHTFSAQASINGQPAIPTGSPTYIPSNSTVRIQFNVLGDLVSYNYTLMNSSAATITYDNRNQRILEFKPTGNSSDIVFQVTTNWGCCSWTYTFPFVIRNSYSVSSLQGGGINIYKESNFEKTKFVGNDLFEIINVNTGVVEYNGVLGESNSIYTSVSSGIYVVRIKYVDGYIENHKIYIGN